MTHLLKLCSCVVVLGALTGCVKLGETGKTAFILTSPSFENRLGQQGYREVLSKATVSRNTKVTRILQRVGSRIAAAANRSDFRWEFTLIESKEQNAWCMPGGKVAVYTGILPAMQNEAGMAVVIGHEVAHATLRHSGQRISQQMVVGLGLSMADITLGNAQQKDTILGLLGAGATVGVVLPFSRGHESEADEVGLRYMAAAGYDPREAVRFWQRFGNAPGAKPPEFLSTHPASSRRARELAARMPRMMQLYQTAAARHGLGESF